ncbi:retrotransposon protein [Cucumis melo var. makuwa]|uniref:Retrotransposon protein n=1 Tax=Cucumis melo var. makuwa TaxID=1194695 RepID=A0A5D3B7Q7_CUCMM|nr:retrotransposon protein [Cucumis melo var. makuwa]TYJ95882.1 retrotransposon protein [Cucumis melo var. makuwa]
MAQRQTLLTLEALMNDNKHLSQTPYDTRHRIRTVADLSSTEIVDVEEMVAMFLNVLAVLVHDVKNCVIQREFGISYVFAGWEGHALDSQILRDALARQNGLQMPKGYYYLCNAGYPNTEGFLAPRYHLQEWRGDENAPTTAKEYFNMKHSSTRNMIERAFDILKGR